MQWTSLGNGALLKQAATAFDVLLTADQNIEFQQNLTTLPIAIVVLVAESNRLESLELPWEPPATPIIHARVLPSRCSNRLPILFEPSFARHHTSS